MSPTFKNLLLLITAVLALVGGYWMAQSLNPPEPQATSLSFGGGELIDFTLPDLDGKKQAFHQWRGKVIVLNFWATWCPPCREEIPLFTALQKKHQDRDLQVVGVAIDNKTAIMVFRQFVNMNYPILIGEDEGLKLVAQYGNRMGSLPYTVIIDRNGTIVARKLGVLTQVELESLVEPHLNPQKISSL
ncbi:MAG: TlpA family protein disulfide reductase [Gammaproteobacteria bacterium]|nr:TlpA family protein disulfide reductase [Gammaproteobacteria bacterium]